MNYVVSRVGLLFFQDRDATARAFLGSCFCIGTPSTFLTAAHCLDQVANDRLWINHHAGPPPELFSQVLRIETVNNADIAILSTDAPGARWVEPFRRVRFFANVGEKVCAFGYPDTATVRDAPSKETPRFFRGTVQRPFLHKTQRPSGCGYRAYELSFPCPHGLSGGPLFLEDDPDTVIGLITENLEVGSELHREERIREQGCKTIVETHRVIEYGVAVNLFEAADALKAVLGEALRII